MVAEQEASQGRACRETDKLLGQAATTVTLRQELQKISSYPMLTEKVRSKFVTSASARSKKRIFKLCAWHTLSHAEQSKGFGFDFVEMVLALNPISKSPLYAMGGSTRDYCSPRTWHARGACHSEASCETV